MRRAMGWRQLACVTLAAALLGSLMMGSAETGNHRRSTRLYVPPPNVDGIRQVAELFFDRRFGEARRLWRMLRQPQAVWVESGTPRETERQVQRAMRDARRQRAVPVFVAYNIPFRDCAQFSAGGATTVQEYLAWIDGFARGIGNGEAMVILEPDGLGIIPWYTPRGASAPEWCQPAEADPLTAASDRLFMLNQAIDRFNQQPNVRVYLDGTHTAWLSVPDMSDRLLKAGVQRATGFFLNVSNYQFTPNLVQYGNWISQCITYVTEVAPDNFAECADQYWNGGPLPAKIAELLGEWTGVALDKFGVWSDTTDVPELNTSGINLRYANNLAGAAPTKSFVIDTSRNSVGPWLPPAYDFPGPFGTDPQDWCNPPGRGNGLRPTTRTNSELLDAYLWVKTPGESDGECNRSLGPPGETIDPEWGLIDPAAGQWFEDQALELSELADPPFDC
jgi:endoglucanase